MNSLILLQVCNKLWVNLSPKRRLNLILLILLMVIVSISEIVSLGALIPFLGALLNPEKVYGLELLRPIFNFFALEGPEEILLPITILFCIVSLLVGLLKLCLLFLSSNFAFLIGAEFGVKLFQNSIYREYEEFLNSNTSEEIGIITIKSGAVITGCIVPVLNIFTAFFLIAGITIAFFLTEPFMTLSVYSCILILYALIYLLTKRRLSNYGIRIATEVSSLMRVLQESLGGIRDLILDGTHNKYTQFYKNADIPLRRSQARVQFIAGSPKYIIEVFGLVLLAVIAYLITGSGEEFVDYIPIFGAFVLGLQKMLPMAQLIYSGLAQINANRKAFDQTIAMLERKINTSYSGESENDISFDDKICLSNISFMYKKGEEKILNSVNLSINKGTRVGIVGTTGSGKSTLIDIIMGLIKPTEGELSIDGFPLGEKNILNWRRKIAHVPQSIFLADASFQENISLGSQIEERIDYKKMMRVAEIAEIADFIESLPEKYDTVIGERGSRLSGGQKQRVGIARALYKSPEILVLDEATSALDTATENKIIQNFEKYLKQTTVVMVTHREQTLRFCKTVFELNNTVLKAKQNNLDEKK